MPSPICAARRENSDCGPEAALALLLGAAAGGAGWQQLCGHRLCWHARQACARQAAGWRTGGATQARDGRQAAPGVLVATHTCIAAAGGRQALLLLQPRHNLLKLGSAVTHAAAHGRGAQHLGWLRCCRRLQAAVAAEWRRATQPPAATGGAWDSCKAACGTCTWSGTAVAVGRGAGGAGSAAREVAVRLRACSRLNVSQKLARACPDALRGASCVRSQLIDTQSVRATGSAVGHRWSFPSGGPAR